MPPKTKPVPAPPASPPDPFAHVGDPNWGRGGSFVVQDGKRMPLIEGDVAAPIEYVGNEAGQLAGNALGDPQE